MEYTETDMWTEDDEEDETETAEEEEEESVVSESKMTDLIEILGNYMKRFEAKRTKELIAKKEEAEEKKKELRYLIGVI